MLWLLLLSVLMTIVAPAFAANPIPVEKITVSSKSVLVPVGKTVSLKANVEPKNASVKTLKWSSSDESIVTVKNGSIKGVACGEATVTVKATDNSGVSAKVKVTVVQPVSKITFSEKTLDLAPGVYHKLKVKVEPANASVKTLSWASSNEKVAKVDKNGVVTGVGKGSAIITATATDGSKKSTSITVSVKKYDLVFTSKRPQKVGYHYSGTGNVKIRGNVKNKNVSIKRLEYDPGSWKMLRKEVDRDFWMMGSSSEQVEVTPLRKGIDEITIKLNSDKLSYSVFVADYYKDNEIQYVPVPNTKPDKKNGKFRDIIYGTSYAKIRKKLIKEYGSDYETNEGGSGLSITFKNPGISVAGHPVESMDFTFCYDEDEKGYINQDTKNSAFYMASYTIKETSYELDDFLDDYILGDNSVTEDLYKKLTEMYGKPNFSFDQDEVSDGREIRWEDKDTDIELEYSASSGEITLEYTWSPGYLKRSRLQDTYDYLQELEEQKKKDAEKKEFDSSKEGL